MGEMVVKIPEIFFDDIIYGWTLKKIADVESTYTFM